MLLHLCFIETRLGSLKQAYLMGFTAVNISVSEVVLFENFLDHLSLRGFYVFNGNLIKTVCLFSMKLLRLFCFVIRLCTLLEDC